MSTEEFPSMASSSMFASGWDDGDEGIYEKDFSDPREQFLTAAEEGNLKTLQSMYAGDPELLQARDIDNYTPLHRAASNNHLGVCKWLLSIGADLEARTSDGWTVLHCAACWSNFDVVALLLTVGARVNSRSNGGLTPLHLAINSRENASEPEFQWRTVKYLLEAPGINLTAVTGGGDTPLMLAQRLSPQIAEMLTRRLNSV